MLHNSSIVRKITIYLFLFYIELETMVLKLYNLKNDYRQKRLLIIKVDAIGDAIIWLDSAKEYKKHFPSTELTLLCNQSWLEIAKKLPYFDHVIPINANKFSKNIRYRFAFLTQIRKIKYSKVISPVYSRDFFVIDSLVRNIRAQEKIGSVGNYENTDNSLRRFFLNYENISLKLKVKADRFYTQLIYAEERPMMELTRNAEFIRNYIAPDFKSQLPQLPFDIPVFKPLEDVEYAILFIGASTLRKVWAPLKNYIPVINAIPFETIVLCGGPEDRPLFEIFQSEVVPFIDKTVISLIGETSLLELISVIKQARFIVTNDTSASHITVAVRTPSICILGGGHFGRFQPYQVEDIRAEDEKYLPHVVNYYMDCYHCNLHCIYIKDKTTTYPCVLRIDYEQVVDAIGGVRNII